MLPGGPDGRPPRSALADGPRKSNVLTAKNGTIKGIFSFFTRASSNRVPIVLSGTLFLPSAESKSDSRE